MPAAFPPHAACRSYGGRENPAPVQANSRTLEARPEADFSPYRRASPFTGPATRSRVTVGQVRQVAVALGRKPHVPHEADVKVRIDGPYPVRAHVVVQGLANLVNHPRLD